MAEVLLFNQYFTSDAKSPDRILATLPINLLCLGSYLKDKDISCKIYELGIFDFDKIIVKNDRIRCGISDEEIISIIKNEAPKIIGLGCVYSRHYIDIISITRLIKKIDPFIKVVLGGNHATAFYDMVLKEPTVDFVVRGEGEITFHELCDEILSNNNGFKNISGLAYNSDGSILKTKDRELIKDLDELPNDYSLLDVEQYANVAYTTPFLMRYPAIGIISSRGCPGNCIYCTVKAVWGRTWRAKSAKKTVDEMELLYKNYGVKEILFLDDSASIDKKRWSSICDEIINRKLNIRWTTPNGIAHWTLDKPILKKMYKSGCYRITFGIESGNPETRKFLGKSFPLSQAKEIIEYANKIGMWTICTNILGFPYETGKAMEDTIKFAQKSGTDFATFYLLAPLVTSDVYNCFKKEGLLNFDHIFKDNVFDEKKYEEMNKIVNDGGTPTKNFSPEELKRIQEKAYRRFLIYRLITYIVKPAHLLRKIRSVESLMYTIRLISSGLKIFIKTFYKKTTKALLYE
ncbi:B12-binding domain-containing radical SAM protein [bacterium]|nr:B12-binding domain-containing radical SAM protein [bacterium]